MNFKNIKHYSKIILFIVIISIFTIPSCKKLPTYPATPAITFKSLTKIPNGTSSDDKGILTISFTDGDGDLGLNEGDTLPPFNRGSQYYYNYIVRYYEKEKGTFVDKTDSLQMTFNSRVPRIVSKTHNKSLKGDIALELYINNYTSPYDTIKFDVYIIDRALHKSNTITTPDIVISK